MSWHDRGVLAARTRRVRDTFYVHRHRSFTSPQRKAESRLFFLIHHGAEGRSCNPTTKPPLKFHTGPRLAGADSSAGAAGNEGIT
jgi:hypothetical protein